jgi:hypothetical protein
MEDLVAETNGAAFVGVPVMSRRFRQFLPVVIDVETGGFNCVTDALLAISEPSRSSSRPNGSSAPSTNLRKTAGGLYGASGGRI